MNKKRQTKIQIKLQPEFQAAVEFLVNRFWQQFGNLTHSLYLYGSVSHGKAISGKSDLDLSVIFHQPVDADTLRKLHDFEQSAEQQCLQFSKVELDIGSFDDVMVSNEYQWQFWLKNYCRFVRGDDLTDKLPIHPPSTAITLAINKDLRKRLQACQAELASKFSVEGVRSITKKLIRTHLDLSSNQLKAWQTSIDDMVQQLCSSEPQFRTEMTVLGRYASGHVNQQNFKLAWLTEYGERVIDLYNSRNQQLGFPEQLD